MNNKIRRLIVGIIFTVVFITGNVLFIINSKSNVNVNINTSKIEEKITPYLFDVREPDEFTNGHISGAVNIPLGYIEKGDEEFLSKFTKEKVNSIYCRSGRRSSIAKRILEEKGYKINDLGSIENASKSLKLDIVK